METGTYLKKRPYTAMDFRISRRWLRDARENPEKRTFAGSVSPHDANNFAVLHVKRDIAESPNPSIVFVRIR
jgi:hypothetical protein